MLKSYDFENGVDEATVLITDPTDANDDATDIDIGTGAEFVYDSANGAAFGDMAVRVSTGATSASARWEWDTSVNTIYARCYVYLPAGWADGLELMRYDNGARMATCRINASEEPTILDSLGANQGSGTALAVDTWHRIEVKFVINGASGTAEIRTFEGANLHGSTANQTVGPATANFGTADTGVWLAFGQATGGTNIGPVWIDGIAISDTDWIGPLEEEPTVIDTKTNVFENSLANGTQLTTGNSGYTGNDALDAIEGQVWMGTSTLTGSRYALCTSVPSAGKQRGLAYMTYHVNGQDIINDARILTPWPRTTFCIMEATGGKDRPNYRIVLLKNGKIQIRNRHDVILGTSTYTVPNGDWWRLRVRSYLHETDPASNILRVAYFTPADASASVETLNFNGADLGVLGRSIRKARVGVLTPSRIANTVQVDSWSVTTGGVPSTPTISSFSPTSGNVGTDVTIFGTNLAGAVVAKIGLTAMAISSIESDGTSMIATVQTGSGSGQITVQTPGGEVTSSGTFTVTAGPDLSPTISGFSPISGPTGTQVTIGGTNFTGATSARIGSVNATINSIAGDGLSMVITIPSTAADGQITVVTPVGQVTSSEVFDVTAAAAADLIIASDGGAFDDSNGTTYTIPSHTYEAGQLYLLSIAGYEAGGVVENPTVAGTGLSWIQAVAYSSGTNAVGIWRCAPSANTTTTVTVSYSAQHEGIVWHRGKISNFDSSNSNGASAIGVTATNSISSPVTQFGTTLTGFGTGASPSHVAYMAATTNTVVAISPVSPGVGIAELGGYFTPPSTGGRTLKVFTSANDSTPEMTWTGAAVARGVSLELIPGEGGEPPPPPPAPTISSFVPTSGEVGISVTVTGTNLSGATNAKIGTTSATINSINGAGTSLVLTVPTSAVSGKVSVTTAGGTAQSSGTFTVTTTPPPDPDEWVPPVPNTDPNPAYDTSLTNPTLTQINNALASLPSDGVLRLLGDFTISGDINPKAGQWIVGPNDGSKTVIRQSADSRTFSLASSTTEDVTLSDLWIRGPNGTGSETGITSWWGFFGRRLEISHFGLKGFGGSMKEPAAGCRVKLDTCYIHDNGEAQFSINPGYASGGVKILGTGLCGNTMGNGFTIINSESSYNYGTGIWFDHMCAGDVVDNNYVHHNQRSGIRFELTGGNSRARGNWSTHNGLSNSGTTDGINVTSSYRTEVIDNDFSRCTQHNARNTGAAVRYTEEERAVKNCPAISGYKSGYFFNYHRCWGNFLDGGTAAGVTHPKVDYDPTPI